LLLWAFYDRPFQILLPEGPEEFYGSAFTCLVLTPVEDKTDSYIHVGLFRPHVEADEYLPELNCAQIAQ
jgi:hypothetical protein